MEEIINAIWNFSSAMIAGMSGLGLFLFCSCAGLFCLGICFLYRIYIAYRMAKNRHRDPLGWTLLSFFFSPIITWIILLVVGDAKE